MHNRLYHWSWSPDSSRIAFFVYINDGHPHEDDPLTLNVIDRDGSNLRELVDMSELRPRGYPYTLEWSPDGSRILFSLGEWWNNWTYGYIYLVDADGSDLRTIVQGLHATWSPDGSRIASSVPRRPEGVPLIMLSTMAADGSDVRVLVRMDSPGDLVAENAQ